MFVCCLLWIRTSQLKQKNNNKKNPNFLLTILKYTFRENLTNKEMKTHENILHLKKNINGAKEMKENAKNGSDLSVEILSNTFK